MPSDEAAGALVEFAGEGSIDFLMAGRSCSFGFRTARAISGRGMCSIRRISSSQS